MSEPHDPASGTEYEEVLHYLYETLPMFQRVGASAFRKDLKNTLVLCEYLGHPERSFRSVHIAGTNGKGSSSHYLASILQTAGYKTGLYTSPHLKSFTERIRINGQMIPATFVVEFVRNHHTFIEELKPSFFEITVGMAFAYFAREKVDIAVIEVGMGGRLDSTNVIIPEVSLITNISLDHQQWLGDTLPEIAREKAGIIKPGVPTVLSELQPEVLGVMEEVTDRVGSTLYKAYNCYELREAGNTWEVWNMNKKDFSISKEGIPTYQRHNLPGVLQTMEVLATRGYPVPKECILQGIEEMVERTGLKGRWQKLSDNPRTYCDVGHNTAGVSFMLRQLEGLVYDRLFIIWGMVNDKDIAPVLDLLPSAAYYLFCQADIPRALNAEDLQRQAEDFGLHGEVVRDVNDAVKTARGMAGKNDFIVIGGSNFVVAELEDL